MENVTIHSVKVSQTVPVFSWLVVFPFQQMEEGILEDQKKALRRYNERKAVSDFQQLQ